MGGIGRGDVLTSPHTEACNQCGSIRVVPIAYGLPTEALRRAERGEVALGGCMVGAPSGDPTHRCLECGAETADDNRRRVMAVSAHEFSRRTGLGLNTVSRLRSGRRSRPTAQTMLAIERAFGWLVAEQVDAMVEGRYTHEINARAFRTEEGAA